MVAGVEESELIPARFKLDDDLRWLIKDHAPELTALVAEGVLTLVERE